MGFMLPDPETKSRTQWISEKILKYIYMIGGTLLGTIGFAWVASVIGRSLPFLSIMCAMISICTLIFGCVLIAFQIDRILTDD